MKIIFKETIGKALLCHIQLITEEVNKKVIDVRECFADCNEVLLASSLSGINSNLSWEKTKIFLEEEFKEKDLLVLMVRGDVCC